MKIFRDLVDGVWSLGRTFLSATESINALSVSVNRLSGQMTVIESDLSRLTGRLDALEKVLLSIVD